LAFLKKVINMERRCIKHEKEIFRFLDGNGYGLRLGSLRWF
jgi:hypothetical protein